jgi:hypothetical protein
MRTQTQWLTQRSHTTQPLALYNLPPLVRGHTYSSMRSHTAACGHIQQHADTYRSMRTHTAACGHIQQHAYTYTACSASTRTHIQQYADTLNVVQLLTHHSHTSHTTQQTACSECRRGWAAARVLRSASASYCRARACAALRMPALQAGRGAGPCYDVVN